MNNDLWAMSKRSNPSIGFNNVWIVYKFNRIEKSIDENQAKRPHCSKINRTSYYYPHK